MQMHINDLIAKIAGLMKKGRLGNNSQANCGPLTQYSIEIFDHVLNGKELKQRIVSTESAGLPNIVFKKYAPIKVESTDKTKPAKIVLSKQTTESHAYRMKEGLTSMLPPEVKNEFNVETSEEKTYVDYESKTVKRKRVERPQDLNEALMKLAKSQGNGKVVFGDVVLSRLDIKTGHPKPGHILAFCASDKEVFFLDGQFHDGRKQIGNPVFLDITEAYDFYDPSDEEKQILAKGFQPICFYLMYGSADCELTGKIILESEPKTINPKAFIITKNTTPEEVMNIPLDKDTVVIEKDANEIALEFIPKHIKSVDLSADYVSYGKVKKLPQHFTTAIIGEPTSPDAVSLLSDSMRMLVIHEDTKIPTLRAIKDTVTTAVVDKNLSAEKIKELENIKMIIFNGDISKEQVWALAPSVGVVSVGEGMSVETAKEIRVPTVIVRKGCHPETVAAFGKVERMDIGVGLAEEVIAKFPPHLQMVGIGVGATPEQVKAIPNYLRTIVLREGANPETVKALPPHIDTVIIGGDTKPDAIQATEGSQSIKYVIVKNTTTQETRDAIPKHLKIYGEEALPAKKTPYKPSLFGSQQDSVFGGSENQYPGFRSKQ